MVDAVENLIALGTIRFDEVADVRRFIEVPSVRLAAQNRTRDQLDQLEMVVDRQKAASVDDREVPELDRRFHLLIAQASENRVLAALVGALHQATEPVRHLDLSPEVGSATVAQHQAIVRAIAEQDADAAENAIIDHLTYLRRHIPAFPPAVPEP